MDFALAPQAAAAGYGLVAHETIGSTNTDAMERLRAGEAGPLWVASRRQSEGRGRRGSAWQSEAGNLAASLALTHTGGAGDGRHDSASWRAWRSCARWIGAVRP
jgi:BirA family biotin operon repressor/biotin-[acetyl-CoA-carboxylase] ligase